MTRLGITAAWLVAACGSSPEPEVFDASVPRVADAEPEPPPAPAFGPEVKSLRLRRSISVRIGPRADADRLGTVARNIRVRWKGATPGPGCDQRWIEIEPRGWVCERYLEPVERSPWSVELPRLDRRAVVPGTYARVVSEGASVWIPVDEGAAPAAAPEAPADAGAPPEIAPGGELVRGRALEGSFMVRRWRERVSGGVVYWRIDQTEREYVRADALRPFEPSTWAGSRLGDDTGLELPVGFAAAHLNIAEHRVHVYSEPVGGTHVGWLQPRQAVHVLETARGDDGRALAHRVADGWVRAADMKVARLAAPPPTTGPHERWIDVELAEQVLVAYEGETPVYATLVASGAGEHTTDTGIFRVWIKFAETDMTGGMGDSDAYSVATVPWTQFFTKDGLALHTAYWHDRFGKRRSHGCINLAPRDARFLYFWSSPDVPPGWSMAHGLPEYPGSMVRVRSPIDPDPDFRGYAEDVYAARRSRRAAR